ncbi:MAG: RdgB/HAM1 family non-canonical purine NTP pyrophosphatase [Breznakia sp.]
MKTIFIATANKHKRKEFQEMLEPLGYDVKCLLDLDEDIKIIEDGETFEENAYKKAKAIYDALHIDVISDDSGLCISAMDDGPGVYSARFLGETTSYVKKNTYILEEIENAQDRSAKFVCVICHITKAGKVSYYRGECHGNIASAMVGEKGFGYDPIFYYPPYKTTLANVSEKEKNDVSHRGRAIQKLLLELKS